MDLFETQPLLANRPRDGYRATSDEFSSVALNPSDLSNTDEASSCTEAADCLPLLAPRRGRGRQASSVCYATGLCYTWRNLCAYGDRGSGQRGKPLLRDVSGRALGGELLAVLGPSGAGKTSLLEALTFRADVASGERLLGGRPADAQQLAAVAAYVAQDNHFVGALTVREHLVFHALLRMDRHVPYDQRLMRVEELLTEFSLTDCQHVMIGIPGRIRGISGGEMKRLAFAAEVLTDPPLMFCDEPTSGLDSFMALAVATALKAMAGKGKTVVATVHQPSSEMYALFDRILLIAEGRVAFQGTPAEALAFFSSMGAACPAGYNPADFFLHLLAVVPDREQQCRRTIELLCDNFERSPHARAALCNGQAGDLEDEQEVVALAAAGRRSSPYKTSWCGQMRAVLWRSWLSVAKEPVLIKMRMLQTMMISLMVGTVFFGQSPNEQGVMNINGAIIIFITNMTFQNIFAVITVFCSEMPVFLHEHRSGMYRVDVYFLSKTLAELPIFSAIPCLFTAVCYYMVGLNPAPDRFFYCMLVAVLVTSVATSFGYFVSCISPSISVAMSMAQPLIFPFLLFGGFFLNVKSVPPALEWLARLSWFRYGNEAMFVNQWEGVSAIECPVNATTCPATGHVVLQTVDFDEGDFVEDLLCLTGLIVGLRVLALVALIVRTWRRGR